MIVILGFTKSFNHLNNEQMESNAIVSSSIIEDIQGIETIKALNSEQTRYRRIDNQFVDFLRKSFKYSKTEALQEALKSFIQMSLNVVVLWVGSWIVMRNQMTIGELMTYNALLAYFVSPLQNIINLQPLLQSANVAQNRLNEVYLVHSEFRNNKTDINKVSQIDGSIEYQNVSFKYGYGKNILQDIDLNISKGEKLAIVGMSGSGKSTLVKLLVSFFDPNGGKITINGIPTTAINKHTLRSYITYVPQTPYTFSGSIRDNLLLGSASNTTEADVIKACQLAEIEKEIEHFIDDINEYDSVVNQTLLPMIKTKIENPKEGYISTIAHPEYYYRIQEVLMMDTDLAAEVLEEAEKRANIEHTSSHSEDLQGNNIGGYTYYFSKKVT